MKLAPLLTFLTDIGHVADNVPSLLNQPSQDTGGIKTTRVSQTDLVKASQKSYNNESNTDVSHQIEKALHTLSFAIVICIEVFKVSMGF